MWDIMRRDKAGQPKEQRFTYWCRRVAACKTSSTATGHAEADSTATEHADSTAAENPESTPLYSQDFEEDVPEEKCLQSWLDQGEWMLPLRTIRPEAVAIRNSIITAIGEEDRRERLREMARDLQVISD